MCQEKYNTKNEEKKYKHINYVERTQIERWYNIEKRSKKEIAQLLNKSERTMRREFNRGKILVKDKLWRDKEIYSVNVKIKVQKNVKIKIHKILYFYFMYLLEY